MHTKEKSQHDLTVNQNQTALEEKKADVIGNGGGYGRVRFITMPICSSGMCSHWDNYNYIAAN